MMSASLVQSNILLSFLKGDKKFSPTTTAVKPPNASERVPPPLFRCTFSNWKAGTILWKQWTKHILLGRDRSSYASGEVKLAPTEHYR